MKINGFKLQQAVREAKADRDQAAAQFNPSLKAFPDEDKPDPVAYADRFVAAETRLSTLQEAQAQFNLAVQVDVQGQKISLMRAIKLIGGAGRLEKMWRSASTPVVNRYGYGEDSRNRDTVVAERVISFEKCAEKRKAAAKRAAALRAAIQMGNAQEIDIDVDISDLLD